MTRIYLYGTLLHDVPLCIFVYTCHVLLLLLLLLCSVLVYCCCCLRLLIVIVCRMVKFDVVVDSSVLFRFIQTRFIFNVPLSSTVAFTASIFLYKIHIIHPRQLRACAEPRQALSRRGGAPLQNMCMYTYNNIYVDSAVSAIEKSDLDRVLRRKRPSSRLGPPFGVVFARRASHCSSLPTLLEAASAVLGVVSRRRVLFSFFWSKLLFPIPHVYLYL